MKPYLRLQPHKHQIKMLNHMPQTHVFPQRGVIITEYMRLFFGSLGVKLCLLVTGMGLNENMVLAAQNCNYRHSSSTGILDMIIKLLILVYFHMIFTTHRLHSITYIELSNFLFSLKLPTNQLLFVVIGAIVQNSTVHLQVKISHDRRFLNFLQ